jgi:hypothetical protein
MKVFLIILAVLVVIIALILSLSAEFTIIFDNGWTTRIKVLFVEKDIELSKILSFILFPEKAAAEVSSERSKQDKSNSSNKKQKPNNSKVDVKVKEEPAKKDENVQKAEPKPNAIKKILDEDGVVGIMLLISNLIETASSAVTTLFKGLHIYSLYVKMIIGGGDAADIAQTYGSMCGIYYPIKGAILNGMKVDQYDDYITADFIAPRSEYEFQLICSINIKLLLKVALKAGKVFLLNLIKNK